MVKRRRLGPDPAQHREILCGAAITGRMVGPVAVFGLIRVASAGDDVHRQPALAELVQCRQFAGGDRRCHEPRPMSQQETKPFSDRCGMRPDQKPVRRIREISDQYPVEAGMFVNAGCLGDNLRIKRRSGRRDDLRRDPWRNPADHFHRHGDMFLN